MSEQTKVELIRAILTARARDGQPDGEPFWSDQAMRALLDERDAAIRRAEEAERERVPPTSRRVLQQPEPAYLAAIIEQFEIIVGSLTDEHLKEHAQTGLDAALRSQESQAPRRDVPSVNAHPHGEPTLPFEDRQWSMPPETDARG